MIPRSVIGRFNGKVITCKNFNMVKILSDAAIEELVNSSPFQGGDCGFDSHLQYTTGKLSTT